MLIHILWASVIFSGPRNRLSWLQVLLPGGWKPNPSYLPYLSGTQHWHWIKLDMSQKSTRCHMDLVTNKTVKTFRIYKGRKNYQIGKKNCFLSTEIFLEENVFNGKCVFVQRATDLLIEFSTHQQYNMSIS